jgi:transcriptional regulator with XRE-family HTH domain
MPDQKNHQAHLTLSQNELMPSGGSGTAGDARRTEISYDRFIHGQIEEARELRGMTEEARGEGTYESRVAISDLERGPTEITASDLMLIAAALEKPITYFFSDFVTIRGASAAELSDNEKELVHFYRQISSDPMQRYALKQIQELAQAAIEAGEEEAKRDVDEVKPPQSSSLTPHS